MCLSQDQTDTMCQKQLGAKAPTPVAAGTRLNVQIVMTTRILSTYFVADTALSHFISFHLPPNFLPVQMLLYL